MKFHSDEEKRRIQHHLDTGSKASATGHCTVNFAKTGQFMSTCVIIFQCCL